MIKTRRPRPLKNSGDPAGSRLTLAHLIVTLENLLRIFAWPLLTAAFFVAFAWLGFFRALYPWGHLAALAIFILAFFESLGRARLIYKPVPLAAARRRLEESSGLAHRPLDTLADRPAVGGEAQESLWRAHVTRERAQLKHLRMPRWKAVFADRDPYALRYAVMILLAAGALCSWGAWGGQLLAAVNPAIGGSMQIFHPALDAWITPPDYTGLPPIMIATPAGARLTNEVIEVPEGSTLNAHLAEHGGDTPLLSVGGADREFATDDHKDFGISETITGGDAITIRRGWHKLGSWRIHVVPDQAPQIAFTDPPAATARKSTRLAYEASDDYGVTSIAARIAPRESLPGADNNPVEISLAAPNGKDVKRVSFEDLTASPWAGTAVEIRLIARDAAGHEAASEPADFVLPERVFFHPLARALIEERKRLLQSPDDDSVRNEAANVMAGIAAHQAAAYHDDPVVLMALRAGAVRLVLDRERETIPPVADMLWQTALRIEDGSMGMAGAQLRDAQKELADALDRGASEDEIQHLIDRLHAALAQYLAHLSAQAARQGTDAFEQSMGAQVNAITPQDLDRMLEQMRDLSASGARDAAREELAQLQQMLENLQTERPQLTADQKAMLARLAALREISRRQKDLLDQTFQRAQGGAQQGNPSARDLAKEQDNLRKALQAIMSGAGEVSGQLGNAGQAMKSAGGDLRQGNAQGAEGDENEALAALRQGIESMTDDLRAAMFMLPRPGGEGMAGSDPFGRSGYGGFAQQGGVHIPDHMEVRRVREILDELQRRAGETGRSKTERDYIDRLLQNF